VDEDDTRFKLIKHAVIDSVLSRREERHFRHRIYFSSSKRIHVSEIFLGLRQQ
ncbi:MAG: hypothetical protein ACI8RD_010686, partial [Bacillariaceae sp.]